jgi:hypothetical protein
VKTKLAIHTFPLRDSESKGTPAMSTSLNGPGFPKSLRSVDFWANPIGVQRPKNITTSQMRWAMGLCLVCEVGDQCEKYHDGQKDHWRKNPKELCPIFFGVEKTNNACENL